MIKLQNVSKSFSMFSLKSVCFEVSKADYYVLLGRSGAGKSLILEIIAGIVAHDDGDVYIDNENVNKKSIQNRSAVIVHQDPALFPHMSVKDNIYYSLKRKKNRASLVDEVDDISNFLGITHLLKRKPGSLSGGEAQRVALARALVAKPKVLLLDEPLSSLDVQLRADMIYLLRKINRSGQTIIHVTHDFKEALALADEVAVVDDGSIIQKGSPDNVFKNPVNSFVANLSGIRNFFSVQIIKRDSEDGVLIAKPEKSSLEFALLSDVEFSSGYIYFSDEDVTLSIQKVKTSAVNNFYGRVVDVIPRGNFTEVIVDIGVQIFAMLSNRSVKQLNVSNGVPIWVNFKASACNFIPKDEY